MEEALVADQNCAFVVEAGAFCRVVGSGGVDDARGDCRGSCYEVNEVCKAERFGDVAVVQGGGLSWIVLLKVERNP